MGANTIPIAIASASANAAHAKDLGKVYFLDGKGYRLVKAAAAIAAAANKVVASALATGAYTWSINVTTTASDPNAVGIVPGSQKGSTGTTGLILGDYFMLQVSGVVDGISAAAIAAGVAVGSSTTAGKIDDASAVAGTSIGISLESAAAADEATGIMLRGLI